MLPIARPLRQVWCGVTIETPSILLSSQPSSRRPSQSSNSFVQKRSTPFSRFNHISFLTTICPGLFRRYTSVSASVNPTGTTPMITPLHRIMIQNPSRHMLRNLPHNLPVDGPQPRVDTPLIIITIHEVSGHDFSRSPVTMCGLSGISTEVQVNVSRFSFLSSQSHRVTPCGCRARRYANRTPDMISELIVNTQTQIRAIRHLHWRLLAVFSPNHFRDVVSRRVRVGVGLTTGLHLLGFLSVTRVLPFTSHTMAFHICPQYTHRSFATQPLRVMRGRPSSQSLYRSTSCPLVERPSTVNCCSCSSPQAQLQPSQTLEALFMYSYLPPGIRYLLTQSQTSTGHASSRFACSASSSPLFETQITSSRSKARVHSSHSSTADQQSGRAPMDDQPRVQWWWDPG